MAVDDLRAIPGLLARHQLVLATRLRIATFQALAAADPRAIFVAMSRLRPRPTLDEIKEWQNRARRMYEAGGEESPTWERAATFVLSFEQRRVGDHMERRLMAEQTELEPEQPPSSWAGWGCDELTDWLRQRTGAVTQPEPEATEALQAAVEPTPARHPLRFERVEVVDAGGPVEIVGAGRQPATALECSQPCWLEVLVRGATPRQEVQLRYACGGTVGRGGAPGRPRRRHATARPASILLTRRQVAITPDSWRGHRTLRQNRSLSSSAR